MVMHPTQFVSAMCTALQGPALHSGIQEPLCEHAAVSCRLKPSQRKVLPKPSSQALAPQHQRAAQHSASRASNKQLTARKLRRAAPQLLC